MKGLLRFQIHPSTDYRYSVSETCLVNLNVVSSFLNVWFQFYRYKNLASKKLKNNGAVCVYICTSDLWILNRDIFWYYSILNYHLDASLIDKFQDKENLLQKASQSGNVALVKTMLSRGFDINSKDSDGDTPLMIAAALGKMEAVNYFLDKGADPSLKDKFGKDSLHRASNSGRHHRDNAVTWSWYQFKR